MIKKIYIKGMHCVACEKLVEDEISQVPFVKGVKVDRKTGVGEIQYGTREPNSSAINEIVIRLGYQASEDPWDENQQDKNKKTRWRDWILSLLVVIFILIAFQFFKNLGILDRIDLKNSEITYGVSFLIGIAASVSSCLAVVGAVVIAFSEKYQGQGNNFYENAVRPNLFFHIGRLVTFFVLGGILGLIGGEISLSGNFIAIFTFIIAFIMAALGLNILGLVPSITDLGVKMPRKFSQPWSRLKKSEHQAAPFFLGGLSFFLPCGFTQSMQIFALVSGSFLAGALSLFLFALGTVPALLILGVTTSWTKKKGIAVFQKVAGIVVILFAIYTFNSALALRGVKSDVLTSKKEDSVSPSQNNQKENENALAQTVVMHLTNRGFEPDVLKIKKGLPVRWVIEGDQVSGCTNKIIVPSLNISQSLSYGQNIIRFMPEKAGEIPFSCWMGMVRGKFIVE